MLISPTSTFHMDFTLGGTTTVDANGVTDRTLHFDLPVVAGAFALGSITQAITTDKALVARGDAPINESWANRVQPFFKNVSGRN